jgi:hypothetical protein
MVSEVEEAGRNELFGNLLVLTESCSVVGGEKKVQQLAKNPCTCALGLKRDTSTHWSLKTDTQTSSTRFSRL